MRKSFLLVLVLQCGLLSAQNWALLNPNYRYNYSNDGSDTISNQVFVEHVDTLGVDSFRYELNRIGEICSQCSSGYTSQCWFGPPTDLILASSPQALGTALEQRGTAWYIVLSEDTLLVETQSSIGSTWTGPGNISGMVYDTMTSMLLGTLDSLKCVAFSNGDTLCFSRDNGIVNVKPVSGGPIALLGRDGPLPNGLHYPRVIDLFDYQIGDALQYHDESTFQSSECVHFVSGTTKYEVTGRVDLDGSTTYTLERTYSSTETSYYPQGWTPCGNSSQTGQDTVILVVDHDRFTDANFFNSGLRGPLFPNALDSAFQVPVTNGLQTMISSQIDNLGRYVIEPNIMHTAGWESALLCSTQEDPEVLFPTSDGMYRFSYTEGIGLTSQDFFSFESGATRVLEGYYLNGEQWGMITSNSEILKVPEDSARQSAVFPNPASDHLLLSSIAPGTKYSILNMTGQLLLTHMTSSSMEYVDVSDLAPGVYVLNIVGYAPIRFVIAR